MRNFLELTVAIILIFILGIAGLLIMEEIEYRQEMAEASREA